MGSIINQEQHNSDTAQLRALSELCPVYTRHLSHHFRNSLSGIVGSADLAHRDLIEKNYEALHNHIARIIAACEHMRRDMEEAGL